jgi:hypothetical protein
MLKYLIPVLLLVTVSLQAEDIDAGITKLSTDLSAAITKSGSKKISVIDFTDLDGRGSELGRFMAEQLSVSLVNSAKDFAVMDRANLASILKEHKLTASGLVNPDNARKLGQFAGVDAIILGTITPFGQSLIVTAKAISTETTQILGVGKATVARSQDVDAMLVPPKTVPSDGGASADDQSTTDAQGKDFSAPNGSNVFNGLSFEIESFKMTAANGILLLAKITNRTKGKPIRVGLNYGLSEQNWHTLTYLVDDQGNTIPTSGSEGIVRMNNNNQGESTYEGMRWLAGVPHQADDFNKYWNQMLEIGSGQSALVTLHFMPQNGSLGSVFRLQSGIICVQMLDAGRFAMELDNVVIEGIRQK